MSTPRLDLGSLASGKFESGDSGCAPSGVCKAGRHLAWPEPGRSEAIRHGHVSQPDHSWRRQSSEKPSKALTMSIAAMTPKSGQSFASAEITQLTLRGIDAGSIAAMPSETRDTVTPEDSAMLHSRDSEGRNATPPLGRAIWGPLT